jgi:hypothetical protein
MEALAEIEALAAIEDRWAGREGERRPRSTSSRACVRSDGTASSSQHLFVPTTR